MDFELKRWKERYIADFQVYADDPTIARWMRDSFPSPCSLMDARAFVEGRLCADDARELARAIVVGEEAVGSICITLGEDVYRRTAELGYWLGEPFRGQHIMTRAVEQICAQAFARFDIARIEALPFADNLASRKVLNGAGFTLEATLHNNVTKNGETHDTCVYALFPPPRLRLAD